MSQTTATGTAHYLLFQVFEEAVLLLPNSSHCLLHNARIIYTFSLKNSSLELKIFMLLFLKTNQRQLMALM